MARCGRSWDPAQSLPQHLVASELALAQPPSHSNQHLRVESSPSDGRFRVTRLQHMLEKPHRHTLSRPMDATIARPSIKKLLHSTRTCGNFLLLPMFSRVPAVSPGSLRRRGLRYRIPFATHIGSVSTSCEAGSANAPRQRYRGRRSFVLSSPADLFKVGVRRSLRPTMFSGTDF